MDLLKLLINASNFGNPCFLCFRNNKNNVDINTVLEIHNKFEIICLSIADMLKNIFPSEEFVATQTCEDCSDLISELYLLLHNRKSKILFLNCLVKQLANNIDSIKSTSSEDKVILNVKLPSCQELYNKNLLDEENEEDYEITENDVCKDISDKSEEQLHPDEIAQVVNICQYCQMFIRGAEEFKSHIKSHRIQLQKRKNYHFCNNCNYKTLSKTTLQAHINKNHLHTRPHICQICYKGFFNRSNLNEHIKTHNNERNQTCELCGCSFIHKKNLIEHLRLHYDTRPYECNMCNKKFVTSGRRSDHIKRSHMEKTECCLICNKKYSLKKELRRHMNNVHLRSM